MAVERDLRVRMERAHVAAWPALETADVAGWLWRRSGGGSQRANSVSTVDFRGEPRGPAVTAAVAAVEALYAARGTAARFQTFTDTAPAGLEAVLADRGYRAGEATTTMFRAAGTVAPADGVEMRARAWEAWLDVYLSTITENRRAVNRRILDSVPAAAAFFGCRRDGRLVATALGVVAHGCAVVECVATLPEVRRTGAATAVMNAVTGWAGRMGVEAVGLQVADGNSGAIRMYEALGFVARVGNRFWVR